MTSKIGISLKQRIREAAWKAMKVVEVNPYTSKYDDVLSEKLQPFYRETYVNRDPPGSHSYITIRGKCVIETKTGQDLIKTFMKKNNLPGCQITIQAGQPLIVKWWCWYDGFIFNDGEAEAITSDPYNNRNFGFSDEAKQHLKKLTMAGIKRGEKGSLRNSVFLHLRDNFRDTYKERSIDQNLMPYITILEVCVMDITNRNQGFLMSSDVQQMKKYLNELLIPGVLVNFTDNVLSTFIWFSCIESKLKMEIEILNEIPSEELTLEHKDETRNAIRESVIGVHQDKALHNAREYKDGIFERLRTFFPNSFKDKFQKGHMPDITVEDECIIDIRTRNRGIVMNKDRYAMKESMIDINLPAVQINFIDGNSAVILWFSCKGGNMNIELEAKGEDMKGASLVDFL